MTPAEKLAYLNDDFKKLKKDIITKKHHYDNATWEVNRESDIAKAETLNRSYKPIKSDKKI